MKIQLTLSQLLIAIALFSATIGATQIVSKASRTTAFAQSVGLQSARDAAIKEAPATTAYVEELLARTVTPIY